MEIRSYLTVIRTQWKAVLIAALIGASAALAVSLTTTPRYESSAQLFVSAPDPAASRDDDLLTRNRIPSYVALLEGEQVAQMVRDATELSVTPAQLTRQVSITSTSDTLLITISVTDVSPNRAQLLANEYAAAFTQMVADLETPVGGGPPAVRATLVQAAKLPVSPTVPKTWLNTALGGLMGLFLGAGLAIYWDRRDDKVVGEESAAVVSGLPILSTVGVEPIWSHTLHVDLPATPDPSTETLRRLRTNFTVAQRHRGANCVVVAGASGDVETAALAASFARTCAAAGQSVALVDCDITGTDDSLTRQLGIGSSIGLTEVLSKSVSAGDAIKAWAGYQGGGSLAVLGVGSAAPGARELLFTKEMENAIRSLEGSWDLVVVVAPAVTEFSDAAALAHTCGSAIIVVRDRHTARSQLRSAVRMLRDADANVGGVVLTTAVRHRTWRRRHRRVPARESSAVTVRREAAGT